MKKASEYQFFDLLEFVTPHRERLIFLLVIMLVTTGFGLLNPWLAGQFTQVLLNQPTSLDMTITQILFFWMFLLAVQASLGFYEEFHLNMVAERIHTDIRIRIFDHLQNLPLSYFHDKKRGDSLSLQAYDTEIISSFVTGSLITLLPQLLTLCGALVMMYLLDPTIAIIAAMALPAFYIILKLLGRKLRPLTEAIANQYGKVLSLSEENLLLLPVIKSFTQEKAESKQFRHNNRKLLELNRQYFFRQGLMSPVVRLLAGCAILLLLWLGTQSLNAGELTEGDLVSLIFYGMLLTRPLGSLADVYGQTQSARGAASRIIRLFNEAAEPDTEHTTPFPEPPDTRIRFEQVSFAYPDRPGLFDQLDLTIEPGEIVALAGINGCGKSTLAHMLMRFVHPNSGHIFIGSQNINDISLHSLRNHIAIVQQDILLRNATIRENILLGATGINDEAILQTAETACALEFIRSLPNGLDTHTGDNGVRLSGGQKQRLSLLRALLRNPDILILDEATAMFDALAEASFVANFSKVSRQRTVIVITHHPYMLKAVSRVVNLDERASA